MDAEYARDLGYAAVIHLHNGGSSALLTLQGGECRPIPFAEVLDQGSGKGLRRGVDTATEGYQVARKYMVRLGPGDFIDEAWVGKLAAAAGLDPAGFRAHFASQRG
jgi:6-phosphofructokinase 1